MQENVFVTPEGDIVLGDFGLAKVLLPPDTHSGLTTTSAPVSVPWCSPELLANPKCRTLQTDIWAFACCILEVRIHCIPTGAAFTDRGSQIVDQVGPYADIEGVGPFPISYAILKGTLPGPSNCLRRVPDLRRIAEDCWNSNPSKRPTASECCSRLSAIVSTQVSPEKLERTTDCAILLCRLFQTPPGLPLREVREKPSQHRLRHRGPTAKMWVDRAPRRLGIPLPQ